VSRVSQKSDQPFFSNTELKQIQIKVVEAYPTRIFTNCHIKSIQSHRIVRNDQLGRLSVPIFTTNATNTNEKKVAHPLESRERQMLFLELKPNRK
jgi:hypothetical protein